MPEHVSGTRARQRISEKIDHLFTTIRRADGREHSYEEVERGTSSRVSRSYVWKLRHGRNRNPSLDVIEALGDFFGVPPAYFFEADESRGAGVHDDAVVAMLLRDPAARAIAERARGLPPAAMDGVLALLDSLRTLDDRAARARPPAALDDHAR